MTVGGAATALALALAAAWLLAVRARDRERALDTDGFTLGGLVAASAAIVVGGTWAWPHVFGATRLWVWDDYTYHMVYPALWLQERAIAAATPLHAFTTQAWYPLSASVVSTWFMLPFAGVRGEALAWVSLTGVLYGGLVAAGAAELFARLGCRRGAWAVPVVLFATSSRVSVMASSFSDADLAQATALFGALVFALPRGDGEGARDVAVDTWYAGLLSGIALGVKVSAAPQAAVVLVLTALRAAAVRRSRMRAFVRTALAFAVAWAATAGYWYVRNVVHAGNPVYPAAFLVWPGVTFPETTLLEYAHRYGPRRALVDALAVYANWPLAHAVLATLGLAGVAGWTLVRARSASRPRRYFALGTLAIAAITLALLPGAPYSAGNALTFRSGFVHWDSMRYVALLPILGWTALGFVLDAALPRERARVPLGRRTAGRRMLAVGAGALVMAGVVAVTHHVKADATGNAFHREPLFGAAAAVLDAQPAGARVAVFGDQWIYPAFGEGLHLYPVRLDRDGRLAEAPIGGAMEPGDPTVDPATFRANLRASGVDVVVLVRQPHPGRPSELPAQHQALEVAGGARLLHRDRGAAIWGLGP